jgi:hypothetical protein
VLDHLDDIASDLSVFHRIDDAAQLSGPAFFALAWRLAAYTGVMQARANAEQQRDEQTSTPQRSEYTAAQQRDRNPGTRTALMAEPAFQGVFSFG